MSTPTASGANAQKAGVTPANATTPQPPSHLAAFSSPAAAPRSVPSPAEKRTQAGKSPFNASTMQASAGGASAALNHPTGGSSTSGAGARLLGSSPAAAAAMMMMNFDSPAAMALSLSNMGGLDGSIGMGLSMSGMSALHLGTSMGGRGDDEERRKRLEAVVNLLKTRTSRVSAEGLELLGKRYGLAVLLDPPDGPRKNGTRECAIAGGSVVVDVGFSKDQTVSRVDVSFPTSPDSVNEHFGSASRIMHENLTVPSDGSPITMNLEKFAKNLERLAKLDKLNGPMNAQTFNCFEAITGVYTSLRKLFEHEKKAAMALLHSKASHKEERAEREVMCKKSGRPVINGRDTVGCNLAYWMKRRHVYTTTKATTKPKETTEPKSEDAMEVDIEEEKSSFDRGCTYSLSIECENSAPELYPSVRTSNAWISDQVEKSSEHPDDVFGPVLDWLDPPPSYLANSGSNQNQGLSLNGDFSAKLPNIRFVAKLEPPLVVPYQTAINILAAVGISTQQEVLQFTPFDRLLLRSEELDPMESLFNLNAIHKDIRCQRSVVVPGINGAERTRLHSNTFVAPKMVEYGRLLEEIPFDHPKQLVQLLPILRQWAFVNSLLTDAFGIKSSTIPEIAANGNLAINALPVDVSFTALIPRIGIIFPLSAPVGSELGNGDVSSAKIELSDLLDDQPLQNGNSASEPKQHVDTCAAIVFDVLPNGGISILDQNVLQDTSASGDSREGQAERNENKNSAAREKEERLMKLSQQLGKGLDVCGDLDVWVEWVDKCSQKHHS